MSTEFEQSVAHRLPPPRRQPRPSKIVDVARGPAVSITTVSARVEWARAGGPEDAAKLVAVVRRLGYRPNRHRATVALQLRAGDRAGVVDAFCGRRNRRGRLGFMMEIAAVAASVALERGLALVLVPPTRAAAAAIEGVGMSMPRWWWSRRVAMQTEQLRWQGIPIVTIIHRRLDAPGCIDHGSACTTRRCCR